MATIRNKQDWIDSANQTIPLLPQYAAENGCQFDAAAAMRLMSMHGYKSIHRRLNQLWLDLPDQPSIRYSPFFDLCDLCSEFWVFEEGDDG